jgi:hypothetical protein
MEKAKAIVNGIVGDHLDETANELATVMAFYDRPTPLGRLPWNWQSCRRRLVGSASLCTD